VKILKNIMMKDFDRIDRYCKNLMDQDEKENFESDLKNSAELVEELEVFKASRIIVHAIKENELKEKMKLWNEEIKIKKMYKQRLLKISASLLFLIILGIAAYLFNYHKNNQINVNNLYASVSEIKTNLKGNSGINSTENDNSLILFEKADSLFNLKNYSEALIIYKKLSSNQNLSNLLTDAADYNYIICLIAENNDKDAIIELNRVKKENNHRYNHKVIKILNDIYKQSGN
jgi:tetratricopeptide (TPR) repeat protein